MNWIRIYLDCYIIYVKSYDTNYRSFFIGLEETFSTTEEHPFWIDGEGWCKASILEAGMKLLDKQGNATATIISQTELDETDTVYNFEVQDFSTYHIGELGVWVHNAQCCQLIKDMYRDADLNSTASLTLGREHSGTILQRNLSNAGVPKPKGTQAHHIVGKSTPEGVRTQNLLKRLGIDINAPANGVYLPGCGASGASGMIHCVDIQRTMKERFGMICNMPHPKKMLSKDYKTLEISCLTILTPH